MITVLANGTMEKYKEKLMEDYFQTKDLYERNQIIKQLLCDLPEDAKDFFIRYLKESDILT